MEALDGSLYKVPAVEVVPIPSIQVSEDEEKLSPDRRDRSSLDINDEDDDDNLSLYEDLVEGMPDDAGSEPGLSNLDAW